MKNENKIKPEKKTKPVTTTVKRSEAKLVKTKPVTQDQLKNLLELQQAEEARRQELEAIREKRVQEEETLRKSGSVQPGPYTVLRRRIERRNPHYKEEVVTLAGRAGLNVDQYLEECRNRGSRSVYFRMIVRTGHEKDNQ